MNKKAIALIAFLASITWAFVIGIVGSKIGFHSTAGIWGSLVGFPGVIASFWTTHWSQTHAETTLSWITAILANWIFYFLVLWTGMSVKRKLARR
jgi:hypothetical protein